MARNELENRILMAFKYYRLFIPLIFLWWLPLGLQAQHSEINKAFEEGRLTLDQKILYQFYAQQQPQKLPESYRSENHKPIKCGTPAHMDLYRNRDAVSPSIAHKVKAGRSSRIPKEYQSRSGKFNILYYTAGDSAVSVRDDNNNSIPDYVEQTAAAADSSYRHEVQTLGYTNPIPRGGRYTIEILDLAPIYGQTVVTNRGTKIQIENDFAENFPSNDDPEGNQRGAVKVTVAHELKHAIQFAAIEWQGEADLWAEMDATLMEEVVYDPVNDYYNYLTNKASIFNSPQNSFYPGSYYHVSWALFFEERYGSGFWPAVWNIIKNNPEITMVDALTRQLGDTEAFNQAYIESQLWHYASGPDRSADDFGFNERRAYPQPDATSGQLFYSEDLKEPGSRNTRDLKEFSASYYTIPPPPKATGKVGIELLSGNAGSGAGLIAYFSDGSSDNITISNRGDGNPQTFETEWKWSDITRIGLVLTNNNTDQTSQEPIVQIGNLNYNSFTVFQNFPNPFRQKTTIRFILGESTDVSLKVYDINGRLVQTLLDDELPAGPHEPTFNGRGLASGVYIFQLVTDRNVVAKKMTLIK